MLFPPTQAPNLYPHGKIAAIHPNGLISYKHNVVRSDGLQAREAARFRVKALEERIAVAKGKKEKKKFETLLEEAIDAEMDLLMEEGGDDDFAGMELDDEVEEEGFPEDEDSDGDQEDTGSIVSSRSKGKGKAKATDEDHDEDGEPSSFSRIPTSLLHKHLSLPTTATPTASDSPQNSTFPKPPLRSSWKSIRARCFTSLPRGGTKSLPPLRTTAAVTSIWHSTTGFTLLTG